MIRHVDLLIGVLRERASYLRAMVPEGLSEIERQSMEAMEQAANELQRLEIGISSALVNLDRPDCAPHVPALLSALSQGQSTNDFVAALAKAHAATSEAGK